MAIKAFPDFAEKLSFMADLLGSIVWMVTIALDEMYTSKTVKSVAKVTVVFQDQDDKVIHDEWVSFEKCSHQEER